MRTLTGIAAMLALGLAVPAMLSGTMQVPSIGALGALVPAHVDAPSFALGAGSGFLTCLLLRVSWRNLPDTLKAWAKTNRNDFRLVGWGAAFLALLYVY